MSMKENKEKYIKWVNGNYDKSILRPEDVNRFDSPTNPLDGNLNLEDRAYLYVSNGFNLMLEGGTGRGKTTLVENIALRLGVPFYRQIGHDKLEVDEALAKPRLVDSTLYLHPGPLTLGMFHEGIYFLDEIAILEPRRLTTFHGVLERKSQNVPTHYGNVTFDIGVENNFSFVGAGNFRYHNPDFTTAALQRFVWLDMPVLSKDQVKQLLIDDANKKSKVRDDPDGFNKVEKKLRGIYDTAKSKDTSHPLEAGGAIAPSSYSDKLSDLITNVNTRIQKYSDDNNFKFDINLETLRRARKCYSPKLSTQDYINIMYETVGFPVAAHLIYGGHNDVAKEMRNIISDEINSANSLFTEGMGNTQTNIHKIKKFLSG